MGSAGLFVALAALLITGAMNPIANGPLQALVQAHVPPDMQGRVFSLIGGVAMGMSPLSLAIAGPVADLVGIRFWYVVGGATMIALGAAGFFVPRCIWRTTGTGLRRPRNR
ncbi:MAG: hypothetical protein NUV94_07820 [Candidatus Acetothermia bacterium]|nr:hypothetical protein [Candidatus Acetothermia bacterium]